MELLTLRAGDFADPKHQCVITCPPDFRKLEEGDKILVLRPWEQSPEELKLGHSMSELKKKQTQRTEQKRMQALHLHQSQSVVVESSSPARTGKHIKFAAQNYSGREAARAGPQTPHVEAAGGEGAKTGGGGRSGPLSASPNNQGRGDLIDLDNLDDDLDRLMASTEGL